MSQRAISQIKENTKIAENILFKIVNSIKPGVSTYELNRIAEQEFKKNNALPSTKFLGLQCYLSIGINEEIFFGEISRAKKIKKGDVIQIGLGLFKNGYFTDLALTKVVSRTSLEKERLIRGPAMALYKAINLLKSNLKLYNISSLIEETLKSYDLTPICEIMGHGIGRNLHQPPSIPNCKNLPFVNYDLRFKKNVIVTIEPFATIGNGKILQEDKTKKYITKDKKFSAHFELPVLIKEKGVEVIGKGIFKFIKSLLKD